MRILVTFAVDAEFAPWRKRHGFTRDEVTVPGLPLERPSYEIFKGEVGGAEVNVLLTGIGWENLFVNVTHKVLLHLLKRRLDCCVSAGLAGGLNGELRRGDVVAATELVLPHGGARIQSNKKLLKLAEQCGARIASTLITETHIVSETSAKSEMSKFGDFVDMESYHILQTLSGTQIPAIAVRSISDAACDDLPLDLRKVVKRDGTIRKALLMGELTRNPRKIPPFIRFGLQSNKASRSLANFLDRFVTLFSDYDRRVAAAAYGEVAAQ